MNYSKLIFARIAVLQQVLFLNLGIYHYVCDATCSVTRCPARVYVVLSMVSRVSHYLVVGPLVIDVAFATYFHQDLSWL